MCGIVGYLGPPLPDARQAIERAALALLHRGPDDGGSWLDEAAGVALAQRRLAIIDVSAAGHQPMASHCGRWMVVFNGEIYNHLELRARLGLPEGDWRGHSDTETLLACVARWGVEQTLGSLDGMFAIALWDRDERRLHLARDRAGEKPLYCGRVGRGWAFASELKALRVLPGFDAGIDRDSVAAFMRHGAVPGARSIHVGIRKVEPGEWLCLSPDDVARGVAPASKRWWHFIDEARRARAEPLSFASDEAAVDALEQVVSRAVRSQMLSDVPLGAFLSGGIDSSTIVSLMQKEGGTKVRTFAIGFREDGFDEAGHAAAVARHLGTDHTTLYVDEAAARDVIPKLPSLYCEPFADASQIPTYLVAKLARERVTVALSGDAGDELFGGYGNYLLAARLWRSLERVPTGLRRALAGGIGAMSPRAWNAVFRALRPVLPRGARERLSGDRLHKGIDLLGARSFESFYRDGFGAHWRPEGVLGVDDGAARRDDVGSLDDFGVFERMMLWDSVGYLPNDILVKVDRAAMAASLETRVPLLDRRVIEFALRLPLDYKVRDGQGKWLLRQVLYRHVPRAIVDRPKMGFAVPIASWLRGPLRGWAEALLDEGRLRREGWFDARVIRQRWDEHQSGDRNWQFPLWRVLMFQAWLESAR